MDRIPRASGKAIGEGDSGGFCAARVVGGGVGVRYFSFCFVCRFDLLLVFFFFLYFFAVQITRNVPRFIGLATASPPKVSSSSTSWQSLLLGTLSPKSRVQKSK